ncbi:hypothetical protein TrVE_jg4808 [Triparma verrucosa]|uniref:GTPase Der n=1 Tax=Triparma verrucosa TaxID=1606542 RepID=A0A9W7BH13_9STRA|nr:hypothetical protein TrVE_jg4808 [Triparma verrucosa]
MKMKHPSTLTSHRSKSKTPIIAILGRPNVGKSALVNRLASSQSGGAIVADESGITRDRTYRYGEFMNKRFQVIDTGGLVFDDRDGLFASQIREQALIAISEASAVILVADGMSGLSSMDLQLSEFLRKEVVRDNIPVHVAINKCESEKTGATQAAEFWQLGLGEPHPVSAIHGVGTAELLERVYEDIFPKEVKEDDEVADFLAEFGITEDPTTDELSHLSKRKQRAMRHLKNNLEEDEVEDEMLNVAIIGRPNVGKSSLLNKIFGDNRAIVSPMAGTTRDSIDAIMEKPSSDPSLPPTLYRFIDTAGIRKKGKIAFGPEFFMVNRALRAIRRSDVCLLVLDATAGVAEQDRILAQKISDDGRACVIVCNKWDAVVDKKDDTYDKAVKYVREELPQVRWAPIIFISAETGQRVNKISSAIDQAVVAHRKRFTTAILNEVLREAVMWQPPPIKRSGASAKIYYCNQVSTRPPTIVVFCNDPNLVGDNYRRYIDRKFREALEGFTSTPIRWVYRGRRVRDVRRAGQGMMNGDPGDGGSGNNFPFPHAN